MKGFLKFLIFVVIVAVIVVVTTGLINTNKENDISTISGDATTKVSGETVVSDEDNLDIKELSDEESDEDIVEDASGEKIETTVSGETVASGETIVSGEESTAKVSGEIAE